jgi:hypothetical protein
VSALTPVLSTVHHPLGSPTGPGLFRVKGLQLPAYVQNIARALQRNGHSESEAIQLAIGAVQRWARGQGKVSPEVRAAAAKALAEWEAAKATAHSHANQNGGASVELAAPSLGEIALSFNEALHPRVPAGGAGGGEFGSKAAGPAKQVPAKSQQAKQQKPGIGAGRKAALAKQAASLHARAKADRMQAAELENQLQTLNAAIKVKVQASAKAKTAAKSAAAKAGTAKKATKVTKATNKAKAARKATATKASLPHMRVRRIVLRSKIHDLRSQARALDKQAASIKLAGDGSAIELVGPHGYEHGWRFVGAPGSHALHPGMQVKAHHSVYGDVQATVTRVHKNGNAVATVHHSKLFGRKELTGIALHKNSVTHIRGPVAPSKANPPSGHVQVWDVKAGRMRTVSKAEAAAGMARYGRSLGAGSPAAAVWERRAVRMVQGANEDDGGFLDLAFAEALAERVPSGKREGGQFHARTSLTRHDTPEQRARAVNAMDERQRAAVRVSTLPPPGFEWARGDRLVQATDTSGRR